MKKSILAVAIKAVPVMMLAAAAMPAAAQKAGDFVLNAGVFHLHTMDKSGSLKIAGTTVPNSSSSVGDATTLGLVGTFFVTDHWSVSLDLGLPPKFDLTATGKTLKDLGVDKIGDAKQWSPAVVAKYHFGDAGAKFRPFVGGGLTYVWFTDISTTQQFQDAMSRSVTKGVVPPAGVLGSKSTIELDSAIAPVLTAGGSYAIDNHWSLGASVSFIPLKSKAKIETKTPTGTIVKSEKDMTLNPLVFFLNVGYKF